MTRRLRSLKEYSPYNIPNFDISTLNPADKDVCEDEGDADGAVLYDPFIIVDPASDSEGAEVDESSTARVAPIARLAPVTSSASAGPASSTGAAAGGSRKRSHRGKRGARQEPAADELTPEEEAERAAKKREAILAKRRAKKEKRRLKGSIPPGRRLVFLRRAAQRTTCTSFATDGAMHSSTGYIGLNDEGKDFNLAYGTAEEVLERLDMFGYEVLDAEGRDDHPICDENGRVFALILGWPDGWEVIWAGVEEAVARLQQALEGLKVPENRRGDFIAYATGFTFGGGPTVPTNFVHTKREAAALDAFFADPNVRAVFKRADDALHTFFPSHWESYHEIQRDLHQYNPKLRPPVPGCPFAASTVNLGPQTVCWTHRDGRNLGHGMCLGGPGGKFKSAKGGHLILHEAKLIIKLSAGRLILFPSACITHQNVPIGQGETRWSITAYSAGGLWRFRAQGMRTEEAFVAADPIGAAEHKARGAYRWEVGCAMFKTLAELEKYWESR